MTSSSSPPLERGLDTMLLVYGMLQGHPAGPVREQFLRAHSGWFTSPVVLFEVKGVLTKVDGVAASDATQTLTQLGRFSVGNSARPGGRGPRRAVGATARRAPRPPGRPLQAAANRSNYCSRRPGRF